MEKSAGKTKTAPCSSPWPQWSLVSRGISGQHKLWVHPHSRLSLGSAYKQCVVAGIKEKSHQHPVLTQEQRKNPTDIPFWPRNKGKIPLTSHSDPRKIFQLCPQIQTGKRNEIILLFQERRDWTKPDQTCSFRKSAPQHLGWSTSCHTNPPSAKPHITGSSFVQEFNLMTK